MSDEGKSWGAALTPAPRENSISGTAALEKENPPRRWLQCEASVRPPVHSLPMFLKS